MAVQSDKISVALRAYASSEATNFYFILAHFIPILQSGTSAPSAFLTLG